MSPSRWFPPRRLVAVDAHDGTDPPAASRLVATALAAEPGAGIVRPTERTRALLVGLPSAPIVAVVPDLAQLLHDVAARGAPRAAGSRLAAGGARACGRLAATSLRHLTDLVRQDLRGIIPVLIELERARLGRVAPAGVALAAALTDLLLAAGHAECLAHVVRFLRRAGARAGFETQNLGHLLPRLASWNVTPDFVIGPMNPRGFRMKPTARAVLEAVRRSPTPVLASELSAVATVPLADAIAYAHAQGAAGVVVSLSELAAAEGSRAQPRSP